MNHQENDAVLRTKGKHDRKDILNNIIQIPKQIFPQRIHRPLLNYKDKFGYHLCLRRLYKTAILGAPVIKRSPGYMGDNGSMPSRRPCQLS